LGIRVGLSILSILVILVIGFSISPVYAGPPVTDIWAFYGEIGGGTVDAKAGGASDGTGVDDFCNDAGNNSPPCVKLVGPDESYQNVVQAIASAGLTGSQIDVTCWKNAPDPAGDGSVTFNFNTPVTGVLPADNCIQNQRADEDLGLGVEPPVTSANPNEIERDELLVLDLTQLVGAGYSNFMYALSSNTDGDDAHLWASDNGPTGTAFVGSISLTSGESLGVDQSTDTYKNFPFKKFLYLKEVGTSSSGDLLMQQIKAEVPVIGGTGIQIDTTSILLAGAQTNAFWIIPIVVSGIIIGIVTIRRK